MTKKQKFEDIATALAMVAAVAVLCVLAAVLQSI